MDIENNSELGKTISLIRGHLAVGSRGCAEDGATLSNQGIGAILSLTATVPGLNLPHHTVEIQDRYPLPSAAIRESVEFIDYYRQRGRRVLVHCEMGISRSPSICACFLHESEGLALEEAHHQIKIHHPIADPHPVLLASIKEYYEHHYRRLDSLPNPSWSGVGR